MNLRGSLSLADDLDRALQRLMALDVEELPVVHPDRSARVVGVLSRRDLMAAYARRRFGAGEGHRESGPADGPAAN